MTGKNRMVFWVLGAGTAGLLGLALWLAVFRGERVAMLSAGTLVLFGIQSALFYRWNRTQSRGLETAQEGYRALRDRLRDRGNRTEVRNTDARNSVQAEPEQARMREPVRALVPESAIAPAAEPARLRAFLRQPEREMRSEPRLAGADFIPEDDRAEPQLTERPVAVAAPDQLELYLEPVINLETRETAHYRASVAQMTADGAHRLDGRDLSRAGQRGLRSGLDLFTLRRAVLAAQRLQRKRDDLVIYVPLGAETLSSSEDTNTLVDEWTRAPDCIVFEIGHGVLAGLDAAGTAGLARLAHSGARFALSRTDASGTALASLRDLNFRTLMFDAKTLDPSGAVPPPWASLARFALLQKFTILVTDVENEGEARSARQWARLASGPLFAPPRLVRSDLESALARRSAA